jgi:hypothetical protein
MIRIARETDAHGHSYFPGFMLENMKQWEREGLITIEESHAKITEAGRRLGGANAAR